MARLSKMQILQAVDLPTEEVEVAEWGGSVLVRGMSGIERDAFEASVVSMKGKESQVDMKNIRAKLCAHCLVDDEGKLLFDESEVLALGRKSAAALDRIFTVAQRLSGISKADVEELTKN
jgi:hypothetical protein